MIENNKLEIKKEEVKSKAVLIFQIITTALYLFFVFFMVYTFIDSVVLVDNPQTHSLGVALYFVFFVIIFGGIGSLIIALVSLAGLIVALFKRKKGFFVSKGKIAYFIVFIILPILTVAIIGILTKLMA